MSRSRTSCSSLYNDTPNNKGMFSEDEDSRDSGLGDMDCGPSFLKGGYIGEQLFSLDEEMEDLILNENIPQKYECKAGARTGRAFTDISNGQSPVSRNSSFHRTKSSLLIRKRILPNLDHQPKRQKELKNHENDQPADHGPPVSRPRCLLRAFSTSTLEVHHSPSTDEDLPQPLIVNYTLPTIRGLKDSVAFRWIGASTLTDLITSLPAQEFLSRYILVDCRYPYEFEGGHIQHAVNLYDPGLCAQFFFEEHLDNSRIPIFYCEYSQKRGPSMAGALRAADRIRNVDRYPHVTFEEIYVLDKGYKGFYEALSNLQSQSLCSPCNYVTMDDKQFNHLLRTFTFHRRNTTAATCVKVESKSRILMRQSSHDSPVGRRMPTRRPLFATTLSTPPGKLDPLRLTFSPDTPLS